MQGFARILDRAEDTAPATRPLQLSRDADGRAFLHEPRRLDMHRHGASGRSKQAFLRRFAKFEQGVPSRDAFPRLSGIPGGERLPRALARLTAERGGRPGPDMPLIEGRTPRRSFETASRRSPPHVVGGVPCRPRIRGGRAFRPLLHGRRRRDAARPFLA